MKQPKHYRQGDVLPVKIETLPITKQLKAKKVILAEGEATGHAHAIHRGATGYAEKGDIAEFLVVDKPTDLVHKEHGTIRLEPGNYLIGRQVEEGEDEEVQRVAD